MSAQSKKEQPVQAYVEALEHAVWQRREIDEARERLQIRDSELAMRAAELDRLIDTLRPFVPVQMVDADSQTAVVRKPGNTTSVYSNVIELFSTEREGRHWTTADIQDELEKRGVIAETKQVYNVLGYLAREGRLMRVGRGRYYIPGIGAGVVTTEEDGE